MKRFHETKEYSFAGLVDTYKKFLVPNFQRSYKWKNKQITEFFSAVEQNNSGYFIGNIVCVLGTDAKDSRLVIVDGQQRLTTITLLLIALRDHAKDVLVSRADDSEKTIEWISDFLKGRDKKERKDYFILKARKKTYNNILEDLITGNLVMDNYDVAQKTYFKSYKILKSLVVDNVGNSVQKLEEFTNKVLDLEVVAIVLNSDKEVFNAFDGLNSKGLGLSTSDQVRNYLLSHADKVGCLEEVEQKWDEMESDFEKTNPDFVTKFLRHLWIAENKYVSGNDLYDVIKKEIDSNKSKKSLIQYCEKIQDYSRFYLGIKYKIFSHYLDNIDETARKVILDFKFVDNQQVYEILLSLYKKSKKDRNFKPKYFRDISQILWNFCLRTRFLVVNPSKYERLFAEYCSLIRDTKSSEIINKSKFFFENLRKLTRDREEFVNSMVDELSYNSDQNIIVFLLRRIMEKNDRGVVTLTEASIEHILPQEPKEWGFTKKEIVDYVHNIGNLTLLHPNDNQKAKNKKMNAKCSEIYDVSHFKFNKEISTKYKDLFVDDYKEAIKQRGQDISEQIYKMTKI